MNVLYSRIGSNMYFNPLEWLVADCGRSKPWIVIMPASIDQRCRWTWNIFPGKRWLKQLLSSLTNHKSSVRSEECTFLSSSGKLWFSEDTYVVDQTGRHILSIFWEIFSILFWEGVWTRCEWSDCWWIWTTNRFTPFYLWHHEAPPKTGTLPY